MKNQFLFGVVVAVIATACGGDKHVQQDSTTVAAPAASPAPSSSSTNSDSIPLGPYKPVDDLVLGGDCPPVTDSPDAEIAAQASAIIPIKVGLTLSHTWRRTAEDYDHECLEQVTGVERDAVVMEMRCPMDTGVKMHAIRRLCRADLRDSHIYLTGMREEFPAVFGGALRLILSSASFAAIKAKREARHRFVTLNFKPFGVVNDIDGELKFDGQSTSRLIINDTVVDVPVIDASFASPVKGQMFNAKILNDDHAPFVLDYRILHSGFSIVFTKVSFPTEHALEQQLAKEKHVDVYGIYFDFASDSIRPESEPVLHEIADALNLNKDWNLTISGHTDSIGGAAANLDLSKRRSEAVRKALIERYKVDGTHLSTNGYGASLPKETNDTDAGRARNRRVELVRQ